MNSKGIFLTLAACVLRLAACGSDRPGPEVRLVRADVGRIGSPDVTREQVEGRLEANLFEEVRSGLRREYVRLTMPRFDFETNLDLPKLLKEMGMTAPFDPGTADFSGITGTRELFISEALQRANITVDEKGTEAAAATVLAMPVSGPPKPVELTADRPFIIAIAERETGAILFLEQVTDPSS